MQNVISLYVDQPLVISVINGCNLICLKKW